MESLKQQVEDLLAMADIRINGDRPRDLLVLNNDFYSKVIREGPLGLGEAYMDGWWDAEHLDEFL